jgi:hypothetical protein
MVMTLQNVPQGLPDLFSAGITLGLRFVIDGVPYECMWRPEIPAGKSRTLTNAELLDEAGAPVFRIPLYAHGRSLHTICVQDEDRIEAIEA